MKTTTKLCIAAALLCGAKLFAGDAFLAPIDWAQVEPLQMAKAEPAGEPAPADGKAPIVPVVDKPFSAGQFLLSPWASLRVHEFDGRAEEIGGGLSLQYHVTDSVAIEPNVLSRGLKFEDGRFGDSFSEFGANLKGYLPLGQSGFAPYGLVGYTHSLLWDENRLNAGAGMELRSSKGFLFLKRLMAFVDGQWTHDFRDVGHALFRIGGGAGF